MSNGTLTPRTKNDEYRQEIAQRSAVAHRHLRESRDHLADLRAEVKETSDDIKFHQREIEECASLLSDLETGQYQPTLPKIAPKGFESATPALDAAAKLIRDSGKALPLSALIEHGMSEKEIEKLEAVTDPELKTVGDLEAWMRSDEWWHRKVKGFGEAKIDKLSDALLKFRGKYPVEEIDAYSPEAAGGAPSAAPVDLGDITDARVWKPCKVLNIEAEEFADGWRGGWEVAGGIECDVELSARPTFSSPDTAAIWAAGNYLDRFPESEVAETVRKWADRIAALAAKSAPAEEAGSGAGDEPTADLDGPDGLDPDNSDDGEAAPDDDGEGFDDAIAGDGESGEEG